VRERQRGAFTSIEDETGIANVIVTPDVFEKARPVLVEEPFLLIEGTLQRQDGVVSVRAARMSPLTVAEVAEVSHDFH
jgi:error-prone DNA polymerase